jgi:farnesyl diphosphate synthase
MGKASGSDAERKKMTYVSVHGIDGARDKAKELIDRAIGELKMVRGNIEPLEAIARFVIERKT